MASIDCYRFLYAHYLPASRTPKIKREMIRPGKFFTPAMAIATIPHRLYKSVNDDDAF